LTLLRWAQSHLFSAGQIVPGGFDRVVEVPLLVRSEWHHGIQAADTIGRVIGKLYRFRSCGDGKCEKYEKKFGARIDALAYSIENWSTVFVKKQKMAQKAGVAGSSPQVR